MQKLTWIEFVENVHGWSQERGIYEHSSSMAQALKTLSEVGELADAVIKRDKDAAADAIGDIAVCLVNYEMMAFGTDPKFPVQSISQGECENVGEIAQCVGELIQYGSDMADHVSFIIELLLGQCREMDLDFMDCCSRAWHEIKDRKGRMVPGGAFVKDA